MNMWGKEGDKGVDEWTDRLGGKERETPVNPVGRHSAGSVPTRRRLMKRGWRRRRRPRPFSPRAGR